MKKPIQYNLDNNELCGLMNNVQLATLGNGISPLEATKEVYEADVLKRIAKVEQAIAKVKLYFNESEESLRCEN